MPSTLKPVSNGLALSRMIQTSAKSKGALVRFCPTTTDPVVIVHFSNLKTASDFHGAFSLFSAAAKSTVKSVEKRLREKRAVKTNLK